VNRSSAQQGNPNRAGLSQSETRARGPTDSQGRPIKIPDRAFVERYSKTVRPECDQPESPSDDAEVRIGRGLKYPKDKGYGKFLETLGYDRNWAGMLAARIVEEGRFQAATARKNSEFAQALRRLAKRRLGPCSSRRARRGTCSGRCRASRTGSLFGARDRPRSECGPEPRLAAPIQDRRHGGRHPAAHPRRHPRARPEDGCGGLRRGDCQGHGAGDGEGPEGGSVGRGQAHIGGESRSSAATRPSANRKIPSCGAKRRLLDFVVDASDERRRQRNAKRPRGDWIDRQAKQVGLIDRQIACL
jgi:hypothetical protein